MHVHRQSRSGSPQDLVLVLAGGNAVGAYHAGAYEALHGSAPPLGDRQPEARVDLRQQLDPNGPAVTLLHLVYRAGPDQLATKSFDYSPSSIRGRWAAGHSDMAARLARLIEPRPEGQRFRHIE
ncbi:hypothetical protein CTI14_07095 [Methylobacterium radiotolerans]|nr:hypothetical protein CTI14_07095 [Methylobacterium radiotolerans]